MAFKKKIKEPYLTESDKKRIAALSDNEYTRTRKCHHKVTLVKKGLPEILINMYAESEEEMAKKIEDQVKWFHDKDSGWKLAKDEKVEATFFGKTISAEEA